MLKPGSKAPDFILPNENGEEVSLSDLLEAGPIVLYFYPADFTPGCTKEACSIREDRVGFIVAAREDEPDLILTVEYANWAAFDRGVEYFEELSTKLRGSTEKMRTLNIERGDLREIGSTFNLQEITFKD